jgi:hypothetical protein
METAAMASVAPLIVSFFIRFLPCARTRRGRILAQVAAFANGAAQAFGKESARHFGRSRFGRRLCASRASIPMPGQDAGNPA